MPQKHKNRLFSSLNVPFYKLEPVCTAASLPPKPHFVLQHAFRVTPSHWITTCPLHCLFPPMNQPAPPPKRPQFPIYRFFSSCPPFPCWLRKFPQSSSPQAAPLSFPPRRKHNAHHCLCNKKTLARHCRSPSTHHKSSQNHATISLNTWPYSHSRFALRHTPCMRFKLPAFTPPLSQYAFTFIAKLFVLPASLRPLVWPPLPTYALLFSP